MPENRRTSGKSEPPTVALQAVRMMPKWQKFVLFWFGLGGLFTEAIWFFTSEYEHHTLDMVAAAALLVVWLWCIAPEWTTRQLDKYAPKAFRKDRRNGNGG